MYFGLLAIAGGSPYDGPETQLVVSGVLHGALLAVSVAEGVVPSDQAAVPGLMRWLRVAGQLVLEIEKRRV